jgi:hypothetical protein
MRLPVAWQWGDFLSKEREAVDSFKNSVLLNM